MGEAKRRVAARRQLEEAILKADPSRVASAVRRLASAASGNLGGDCYIHAAIAQAILSRLGVEAKICAGESAWRVGEDSGDVIVHAQLPWMIPQPGGVAYHVWLEIGQYYIFDITLYQLPSKARVLDQLDGGRTTVDWCPDFLFVEKNSVSTLKDVTQLHAGLYYYSREPAVETRILSTAPDLDQGDVETAWLLYQNPDLVAFGPNDVLEEN